MYEQTKQLYVFGPFQVDPKERLLLRDGKPVPLAPKVAETLLVLIQNAGHLVEKDDLMKKVWPDAFVEEGNLNKNISILRKTLGQWDGGLECIETVPKRGYRFVFPLQDLRPSLSQQEQVVNGNDTVRSVIEALPDRADDLDLVEVGSTEAGGDHKAGSETQLGSVPRRKSFSLLLRRARFVVVAVVTGTMAGALTYTLLSPPKGLELRQLTANSIENPVVQSVISPDGRYLAFTDATFKMRCKVIASDETLAIPEPDSLNSSVRWEIAAWFPDSTRFLANARPLNVDGIHYSARGTSVWIVSLGGVPRKLRDEAEAFSVSPDGSRIAFGANAAAHGDREIWVMNPNGQEARMVFDTDEDSFICCLQLSQDQQHAIYLKGDKSRAAGPDWAGGPAAILSSGLEGGSTTTILPISNLEELVGFLWLPDGRLIYTFRDYLHRKGSLWELRTDPHTGKPIRKSSLVTEWDGFGAFGLSATSDGKTIAFTKKASPETIQIADVQASGTRIDSMKRLTRNEYDNQAQAWTPDGKSIIFFSRRNGRAGLFRYSLDSDTEEPLAGGANNITGPAVSPDGFWLYYLDCNQEGGCGNTLPANRAPLVPLMRVPLKGGTPRLVFTTKQYGRPRCAVSPANLCVIAEQNQDGQPITFSSFDALNGRGGELFRFEPERNAAYNWALSSDGTRIAILREGSSRIRIVKLNGEPPSEFAVTGWSHLERPFWAADGTGLFTSAKTEVGWTLLHVDLKGNADRLWEHEGPSLVHGLPSPDGHHLAINAVSASGNAWTLKNF
jgi:DNA-binding winged helix-turn-helix (wHTH) protein/Tol biopolymer transport system component